jgi:hypothetical protein
MEQVISPAIPAIGKGLPNPATHPSSLVATFLRGVAGDGSAGDRRAAKQVASMTERIIPVYRDIFISPVARQEVRPNGPRHWGEPPEV